MKKTISFIFIFSLLIMSLTGCGSSNNEKKIIVGIDPIFYPASLGALENKTYGFSKELLLELAEALKNVRFYSVKSNWDFLFEGLDEEKYQAIFSFKYPYNFLKDKYCFSNLVLENGPALVVNKSSDMKSLQQFKGKIIGYIAGEESVYLIEKDPDIIIKSYDSYVSVLEDVASGFLDGALIRFIKGSNFVNNLFSDSLKILPPLNDEGLRLVSLSSEKEVIEIINKGLLILEKKGTIAKLRKKWGLN